MLQIPKSCNIPFTIMALSIRQIKAALLAAAKMRPPRKMMFGAAIQEPELCLYCMRKYSNNDEVYATPGCLLKNETLPKFGGDLQLSCGRIRQFDPAYSLPKSKRFLLFTSSDFSFDPASISFPSVRVHYLWSVAKSYGL